jgi:hypothetical protein
MLQCTAGNQSGLIWETRASPVDSPAYKVHVTYNLIHVVCFVAGNQSGLIWETRASPADYRLDSLSPEVYNALLQAHILVSE